MQETWVRSLGQEDPGEGHGNHSSILAWRIPMDREAWWARVKNHKEADSSDNMHACKVLNRVPCVIQEALTSYLVIHSNV